MPSEIAGLLDRGGDARAGLTCVQLRHAVSSWESRRGRAGTTRATSASDASKWQRVFVAVSAFSADAAAGYRLTGGSGGAAGGACEATCEAGEGAGTASARVVTWLRATSAVRDTALTIRVLGVVLVAWPRSSLLPCGVSTSALPTTVDCTLLTVVEVSFPRDALAAVERGAAGRCCGQ